MTLSDLLWRFTTDDRPDTLMLDGPATMGQLVAATTFYAGYAKIKSLPGIDSPINDDTDLTTSEWALVRPLFLLYIERETALQFEASRSQNIEQFGRTSSEVESEISLYQEGLPKKAFSMRIINL